MTNAGATDTTPHDAAQALATLGLHVVPVDGATRFPRGLNDWGGAATTDPATIDRWWEGKFRDRGVGIVTGPASKVWVIDVDIKDGKQGRQSLEALEATHGKLPPTVTAITTTGGRHLYFRWDANHPIRNVQEGPGNRHMPLGPDIDIRGDGGFVVAPPTINPRHGAYRWIAGRDPWSHQVADAPAWLYGLLAAPPPPNLTLVPTPKTPTTPAAGPEDSAAEWLRRQHTWAEVLERDGWTVHSHRGDDTYWTRPGKHPRDGHSAVQHGEGALVVFTTEIPAGLANAGKPTADGSGISVSIFGYVAGTRYGGDRSACARDARLTINALQRPATGLTSPPTDTPAQPGGDDTAEYGPFHGFGPWAPVDLARYLDPNWAPDPPTLLQRDDGAALYYRRNVNWLHGASGEGKTWVALVAVAQELQGDRDVVWVHYEDPEADKITHRLVLLGVPPETILQRFHACVVQSSSMVDGIPMLRAVISYFGADLVVIDSIGEAIGSDGVAVKEDEKFVGWIHQTCRVLAGDGNTVLGIDHLPMGEPGRLDPVGSFRKKAATTGSMFLAESPKPPTKGKAGYIKLTCAKDRSGVWTKGEVAAIIHMAPKPDGGIDVTVTAPKAETSGDRCGEPMAIVVARHAYRAVAKRGALSTTQLKAAMVEVQGSGAMKQSGIDFAVLQGWLIESAGARNARVFNVGEAPPTAADLLEQWENR